MFAFVTIDKSKCRKQAPDKTLCAMEVRPLQLEFIFLGPKVG